MPALTPDLDVANRLQTLGYGTVGTSIFVGKERPPSSRVPKVAIFCRAYEGPAPSPYLGNQKEWREYRVQVLFRGARESEGTLQATARGAKDALVKDGVGSYTGVYALQPDPIEFPLSGLDLPRQTVNLRLTIDANL